MRNNASRMGIFIGFALVAILWCVSSTPLDAQTVSGTILGVVQDQQGAVIGKAEITARSLDTGAIRKATSEDNGTYQITSVPAGAYELSVTIAGFKTEVRSGINVTVGSDVSVNFSLTVGAISEKVEVTAEAPQVDASSSALGGFVNSTTIRELPLNGRDWIALSLLQPGVNANAAQNANDLSRAQRGNGMAISIGGGRHTDNAFRIDGIIVNDYANGGPGSALRVNMGVDAIREFSVLTNNYSAEYGRGSGGIVNAITKSGTNQFHGGAYYFHRNSALDARNFFDAATIPAFRRHQYGGFVGGPIKKDKTFFFANYESLHEVKSLSAADDTLSANAQQGILCANTACTSTTQVAIDPKVKPFITLFPLPTGTVNGNTGKFVFAPHRLGKEDYVTGKIDHYFSAATTFFGSYTYDNTNVSSADNYNQKDTFNPSKRQNGVLSLQHLFSPTLINNVRAGVTRFYGGNAIDGNPRDPRFTDPNYGFLPGRFFGQIIVAGVANGTATGIPSGIFSSGENFFGYTSPQVYDDLSWTKGRHSVRVGFNYEKILYNIFEPSKPNGVWTFPSILDFLQDRPSLYNGDLPITDAFRSERMSLFGGYIQDDFRLLTNLTINIGVRYEMGTVVTEKHNRTANLRNLTDPFPFIGDPYYNNPTKKDFAPRFGFAWDPFKNGKTAVRGGFGMFDIVPLPYLWTARMPRSMPFFELGTLKNPPPSAFPNQVLPLLGISSLLASSIELNPKRSYRMQWNLNIQRQLTRNMALTAGYSGSAGIHLIHQEEDIDEVPATLVHFDSALDSYVFPTTGPIQRINPGFGSIRHSDWSGQSNYHALQVNLVQRPVKGLSYQIAYTYSKSIDNGSAVFQGGNESFNTAAASWAFDPTINRGVSDFNIPHNFVLNGQYDLPTPGFAKKNGFTKTILGGWQLGGIYTRQTGGPFTLRISSDQARTGNSQTAASNGAQRPQMVAGPGCNSPTTGDIGHYINTACFSFPIPGQLGNEGRNIMRMPTFRDLDFTVFKNQNLWGEKLKAQFRVEMFNVLNQTNLTGQLQFLFDGNGKLIPTVGTPIAPTANTSRQIQLGLRLLF